METIEHFAHRRCLGVHLPLVVDEALYDPYVTKLYCYV